MPAILLVDDDENILNTYKEILELVGHKVHVAANPYKAIQIMKNQEIQLALLDYNLPNMTGTQLGHLIKKVDKKIEIIFISGETEIHEIVKGVKYDVCKVFSKPIDLEELILCIDGALGGESKICKPTKVKANTKPNQITRFIENVTQIPSGFSLKI
jgi:two-component system phosphoglycerate transport system response regulator PgtA